MRITAGHGPLTVRWTEPARSSPESRPIPRQPRPVPNPHLAGSVVLADEAGSVVLADEAGSVVLADEAGSVVLADEAGSVVLVDEAGSLAEFDVRCLVRNPLIWQRVNRAVSGARRSGARELTRPEAAFWQGIVRQVAQAGQRRLTALDF